MSMSMSALPFAKRYASAGQVRVPKL